MPGSVSASDADAGSSDNCVISGRFVSAADPNVDLSNLTCADLGTVEAMLTVRDNNVRCSDLGFDPNNATCQFTVLVQDVAAPRISLTYGLLRKHICNIRVRYFATCFWNHSVQQ
jgi:hypothetical protein